MIDSLKTFALSDDFGGESARRTAPGYSCGMWLSRFAAASRVRKNYCLTCRDVIGKCVQASKRGGTRCPESLDI